MIAVKTIRWQCSGCNHLCAMLLDELLEPISLVKCNLMKWRKVVKDDTIDDLYPGTGIVTQCWKQWGEDK